MQRCACGKPLHYRSPDLQKLVERFVASHGEEIVVRVTGVDAAFAVSRHYLALHGLRARDLDRLAARGIVRRLSS